MTKTLKVEGMMCQHCVAHVKKALEGVEESALDQAYRNFIIEEFLRESILRERQRSEKEEEEGLTPSSFSVWRADAPPVPLN